MIFKRRRAADDTAATAEHGAGDGAIHVGGGSSAPISAHVDKSTHVHLHPPKGLISLAGGRLVFGEAVAHIADSLSPLGPAGRVVAESYALAAEARRIDRETRAADDRELKLALLERRRRESSATLRQMRVELGRADASARALRQCMVNMQRATVRPGLDAEERRAYIDLTRHFTTMLVQHHAELTGGVGAVVDKVLNGPGATALAPGPREPAHTRQPGPAGRARRNGRGRR